MTSITYGNSLTGTISYDTQYRITGITTGAVLSLTYSSYDANGNITGITNTLDTTKNKTFTYDNLDRLSTAVSTGIWGTLSWTYDGVGNRLTENSNNYTYTSSTNRLATANGNSYTYDNNGNTTAEGSKQFIYNQNQRLIQANNGGTTAYYTYNGNGQRVKKTVNSVSTIFHYSQGGQIIAESDSTGTTTAEYVYLNSQPISKIVGTNTYYYHNDHLGTPQKMTDASGTVVWAADYKPFGEATVTVSTITNNLRGIGQYADTETGLLCNYSRNLNTTIGRYNEADRIGLRGGINPYAFVKNNPTRYIDPQGKVAWIPIVVDLLAYYGAGKIGLEWGSDARKIYDNINRYNMLIDAQNANAELMNRIQDEMLHSMNDPKRMIELDNLWQRAYDRNETYIFEINRLVTEAGVDIYSKLIEKSLYKFKKCE